MSNKTENQEALKLAIDTMDDDSVSNELWLGFVMDAGYDDVNDFLRDHA